MGSATWTSTHQPDLAMPTTKCPTHQIQRWTLSPRDGTIFSVGSSLMAGYLHHMETQHFVLIGIAMLNTDFPSLHALLLSELSSMGFRMPCDV
jgi:hypothetical protein